MTLEGFWLDRYFKGKGAVTEPVLRDHLIRKYGVPKPAASRVIQDLVNQGYLNAYSLKNLKYKVFSKGQSPR